MKKVDKENNLKTKCPVCQCELENIDKECPCCGFKELHKEFNSSQEKKKWEEKVVFPLKVLWQSSQKIYEQVVRRYEKAKQDFLKALNSIGKLTPQERQRLLEEFYGAAKVKLVFDFFNNYFNK